MLTLIFSSTPTVVSMATDTPLRAAVAQLLTGVVHDADPVRLPAGAVIPSRRWDGVRRQFSYAGADLLAWPGWDRVRIRERVAYTDAAALAAALAAGEVDLLDLVSDAPDAHPDLPRLVVRWRPLRHALDDLVACCPSPLDRHAFWAHRPNDPAPLIAGWRV